MFTLSAFDPCCGAVVVPSTEECSDDRQFVCVGGFLVYCIVSYSVMDNIYAKVDKCNLVAELWFDREADIRNDVIGVVVAFIM